MDTGNIQACATSACGNNQLDLREVCDDGNHRSGDGCPADCTQPCGDGVLDPDETCDDGNTADGDGCSADCGSLDSVFLVTPPMVSFMAMEGDAPPPAIAVRVRFEYRGDRVLAGYAPEAPQPTWLSISDATSSAATAEFELRATDTSVTGVRFTTVRLLLSHQNSTGLKTFDLPVAYNVVSSDLMIQATPATLAFTASTGDVVVGPQAVNVTFNGVDAAVVSAPQ